MMMSKLALAEVVKIHFINGYDRDAKAQEAFDRVRNELNDAPHANAYEAPSFNDYAEAVEAIDEKQMATERDFEEACDAAPPHIRQDVYIKAWQNAWAAEVYYEYETDAERWAVAIETAKMIIDAPADFGLVV